MPTRPDIIVTGEWPSDRRLVAEVKIGGDAEAAEQQLMRYLTDYNCPIGLLVTGTEIRVLKDTFKWMGTTTHERVAVHSLPESLARQATTGVGLARAVQDWLERLAEQGTVIVDDADLAATLDAHVVPALRGSDIRAAGPRWIREAAAR